MSVLFFVVAHSGSQASVAAVQSLVEHAPVGPWVAQRKGNGLRGKAKRGSEKELRDPEFAPRVFREWRWWVSQRQAATGLGKSGETRRKDLKTIFK